VAPATGTAILVLVAFVLPGFVALRYRERTYVTTAEDTPFERLLNALYYSSLTYLALFGAAIALGYDAADVRAFYGGDKALSCYVGLGAAGFVSSLAIAELARQWNRSGARTWVLARAGIDAVHATPSGWEHFFQKGYRAFLRVTLKDGRVVAGYFGNRSFAGYTADTPDLYLEQRYQLNEQDWFDGAAPGTLGVYVRADEIVSVEFYEAPAPADLAQKIPWWRVFRRVRSSKMQDHEREQSGSAPASEEVGRDNTVGSAARADDEPTSAERRADLGSAEQE
jgi:hypothetical protein